MLYRAHDKTASKNMLRVLQTVRNPMYLDWDTYIEPTTMQAVRGAHAILAYGVKPLKTGQCEHAIALVRPLAITWVGGDLVDSVCSTNRAAATASLLDSYNVIAVIDFDAHYGDGFTEIFYEDDRVLYISLY